MKVIFEKEGEMDITGLYWNSKADKLLIAYEALDGIDLEILNGETWEAEVKRTLSIDKEIQSIALSDDLTKILLTFEKDAVLYSLTRNKIQNKLHRDEAFLKGGFAKNTCAWFTIPASSGSVDWSYWNYETNDFQEYELERFDHYCRGAVIHPNHELIGACWNAYESGFLIHLANPEKKRLKYFDFGENGCDRTEYELYAPALNFKGNQIAFVVNPYLGARKNIEKVCIYDIFDQRMARVEISLDDYEKESVIETLFIGGDNYLLLRKNCAVDIIDFKAKNKLSRIFHNKVECVAGQKVKSQFAIGTGNKLTIYEIGSRANESYEDLLDLSVKLADKLIRNFSDKLEIAGDEEVQIFAAIDDRHEIPRVYVKFGFEQATYRLDTKRFISGNLSPEVEKQVEQWFEKNLQVQMEKWKKNHAHKKRFTLKSDDYVVIDIFTGKEAALDLSPNVRVFYKDKRFCVGMEYLADDLIKIPPEIREKLKKWVDDHYELITAAWKESENDTTTFWSKLKKWWS